ncbi:MAG: TonB-dependent receptor, partial [Prolixibacteraceae bacterium]|nr:TonB-dependent receptor [Prolixibacteraceae bacterium]
MKKYIVLFTFLVTGVYVNAQLIKGVVYSKEENENSPLPGVNIYWDGTQIGTNSDANGSFELKKPNGAHMLMFSFVGYKTKMVHISDNKALKIELEPNLELGEVTVIQKDRGTYLSVINPIQTENIGGAELLKAACCNLAESFETNPSVDVNYSDAVTGAKQIRLLGLEGTYSLLQVENLPNLRGLATNFGLNYVPGPWMESIQVSKGAASVLNGYESIAGQINVEYKKPDAQENLFLNVFQSTEGKTEFNGNKSFRMNEKLTTGLFVHIENLSKINDHNSDGFLDHPLIKQINVFNRWKFTNQKDFMAQAGFSVLAEDRLGGQNNVSFGMVPLISNPYGINIRTNRYEGFFKTGYVFPDGHTAIAFLSNAAQHHTRSFYGLNRYNADETRIYSNFVYTRDLDFFGYHTLNAGGSFVYNKFDEELYGRFINRKEAVPGLFAEYTFKPNDQLTLMTGIRIDFHNIFGTFVTPRMHFKYHFGNYYTIRLSAGKGYRTANVLSENIYLLANARPLLWESDVFQEKAWNYGISFVQNYSVWNKDLQINAEYFRTDFQEQLIVDRETSSENILLSPLNGQSYANSFQLDLRYEPVERLDVLLAYRINDVKQTIKGELLEKPLSSRYKGLINLNYSTRLKKWMFDYTIQFNGGGRIPRVYENWMSTADISGDFFEFSPFTVMNAQITKFFRYWNIYIGSENFTDFRQKNPITGAEDPFGDQFDATNVWGP